jgi:glycogen debranching enzyme
VEDRLAEAQFDIHPSPDTAAIGKLVLKHGEAFLVCTRLGDLPAFFEGELGFYHGGTRHLRWLELRLNGSRPLLLSAEVSSDNDQILVALTNADLEADGCQVPRDTIHVERRLAVLEPHLLQTLVVSSFHDQPCTVTIELLFSAEFRDLFEVRGMHRRERGRLLPEERDGGRVRLRYRGLDDVVRGTDVAFDPPPLLVAANRAVYRLRLAPGAPVTLQVTASAWEAAPPPAPPALTDAVAAVRRAARHRQAEAVRITTDHEPFNRIVRRSLADLEMLLTDTPHGRVPYAGVPWYVAPFGRDSLITALFALPYDPGIAAATLRFLAAWQGRTSDAFVDQEPGKILHEYRRGEMANRREIPFVPYYGTVDATPLFVVLLAEYLAWTADLPLVRALCPAARAALTWMREHGDRDGDGYLEYARRSPIGLDNQGWKDSADAVMHADGRLASTPIALAEVQGYAYAALVGASRLAGALGDPALAGLLRVEAEKLREAFGRDFWLEGLGCYALALDGDKQPCAVITSNPGHCLWAGIADPARAEVIGTRLLADDMFSGWGIRTLSSRERRYNPMSYHNGSVWPHDNALIAAGLRRYGRVDGTVTLASALIDAAQWFEDGRMPELFCGFPRHPEHGPTRYPVACAPQAWAAATPLALLTALLGLEADARGERLTVQRPVLPPWLRFVELRGLRVGASRLDIGVSQGRHGASVELLGRQGDAELIVRR